MLLILLHRITKNDKLYQILSNRARVIMIQKIALKQKKAMEDENG